MRKKSLIIIIVIGALALFTITIACLLINNNSSQVSNSSRKDGEETQELTDTELEPQGLDGSLENSIEATEPTSKEVEGVQVVLLPEAISIEDGDIGAFYSNEDFSKVIPVDIDSFSEEELPSKYDSRDVNGKRYITAVEDQGYTYLCWAYACLGAVEADIIKHHDEIGWKDLDLSEKHMAYYNMHKAEGSVQGYLDGDYREFVNADGEKGAWIFDYDTNYIATGGVADFCISLMTAWKGPVAETGNDAFKSIYGEEYLFRDNGDTPSPAYTSDYHVQAVNQIAANVKNNAMIKRMIMEHGAVTAGIYADDRFWKNHCGTLYSNFGGKEIPTANHEVIIVGWDDDFDKSKFAMTPEENGAWICRNSWGENSGEGGYFYLSYYDETCGINNVAGYSVAAKGDKDFFDNNYQVAGFLTYVISTLEDSDNYVTAYTEAANPYGICYRAEGDEKLEAIGLMGLETYQQYEFDIYVKHTGAEESFDEDKISLMDLANPDISFKGEAISGGYHTFRLPNSLELAAGDEFFIMVKPVTKGRLAFESTVDNISKPNYDEWKNLTGNIHNNYEASGCSYYIAEDGKSMVRQTDKDFFVKAYTNNR